MNLIDKALKLAVNIHSGQTDKSGEPYILHILAVAEMAQNEDEFVTALLHDVIEDSGGRIKVLDLEQAGFPLHILDAVVALTRCPWETYFEYLDRCIQDPLALQIKYYDLLHNLDPKRQNFKGAESLGRRHLKALAIVEKAIMEPLFEATRNAAN